MRATQIALATAFLLAGSAVAQAQHPAHHPAPVPVSTVRHANPPVVRTTGTTPHSHATLFNGTQTAASNSNTPLAGGLAPLSLQDLLNPYPSLPFSNNQSAYNNRQLAVMAAIDPITQFQIAQAERLLKLSPITTSGFAYFMPSEPYVVSEPAPQQQQQQAPQIIILQQPAPAAQQPAPAQSSEPTQAAPPPEAPLRDVGEFVLVKRDGAQILAIGFTRQGDHIVYITQQGLRRSLPLIDLDPTATEQANDDRGTPLRLPL
jgi:hypothetical protein